MVGFVLSAVKRPDELSCTQKIMMKLVVNFCDFRERIVNKYYVILNSSLDYTIYMQNNAVMHLIFIPCM